VPLLAGDGHTPRSSVDVGAGGAYRIALGGIDDIARVPDGGIATGGPVPVAWARYGLDDDFDVALGAAGSIVRAEARYAPRTTELGEVRVGAGLAAQVGVPDTGGLRLGAEIPLLLTFGAGLYEAWGGLRLGIEHLTIHDPQTTSLVLGAGAVVGLAVGYRHLHAMIELTTTYETWLGDVEASGFVLTPAFALRLRF